VLKREEFYAFGFSFESVLIVGNSRDITRPTGATIATFVVLLRRDTRHATARTRSIHGVLIRGDFRSVREVTRRSRVEHCGGNAHHKIRRKVTEHGAILANNRILARRKPVRNVRRVLADLNDIDEMIQALNVARIVPPKVRDLLALLGNQVRHCSDPARIKERIVAALHCILHIREVVHSLAGVALLASRSLDLAKLRSDIATASGNADTVARHLARLRQATDDIFGLLCVEVCGGIVNGNLANNGGGRELGEAESDHSRASYHKSSALSSAYPRNVDRLWITLFVNENRQDSHLILTVCICQHLGTILTVGWRVDSMKC